MAIVQTIEHKRGDTFKLVGFFGEETAKTDLTGASLRAQLRASDGTILYAFTPTIDMAARTFTLRAEHTDTALWALDTYFCDTELTDSLGDVVSSPTFKVKVVEDITR